MIGEGTAISSDELMSWPKQLCERNEDWGYCPYEIYPTTYKVCCTELHRYCCCSSWVMMYCMSMVCTNSPHYDCWNTLSWNFSEIHNQIHTFCKPRLSLRTNFWTWFSRCTNITMLCWHNIKVRRLHFFRTRLPAFKTSLNLKTKREM